MPVRQDIDGLQEYERSPHGLYDVTHDFDTLDRIEDTVKPIAERRGGQ